MEISNFVLFGIIELYVVLIAVCIYLIVHTRSLRKLVKRLQDKLEEMVGEIKTARKETKKAKAALANNTPAELYKKQIADQLLITRDYHSSLDAGQDIALDLSLDNPLPRRTAAFRHALLIAEKEALHASEDEKPNWAILEVKFDQILQFFNFKPKAAEAAPAPEVDTEALEALQQELEASEKRIENLEKFKKLFFDMEDQWRDAKKQADEYYEQLSAMAGTVEDQDSYEAILENYNQVYNRIGDTIEIAANGGKPSNSAGDTIIVEGGNKRNISTIEITRDNDKTLSELAELRNVAADQHRIIAELQRKLSNSTSAEEKTNMIAELSEQLERQSRFVKESETCMQLLEDELGRSMQEVADLEARLKSSGEELAQIPKLQNLVQQFTAESKDMLEVITRLEHENEQLASQIDSGGVGGGDGESGLDPDMLASLQEELLNTKTQYAELEERYLDLKMQSI